MKFKAFVGLSAILALVGMSMAVSPTLSSPQPADNATSVQPGSNLSVLYEDSDGESGTVTFYDLSNDSEIGQATSVSNGSTAEVSTSLQYGESLEWYAVADDGNSSSSNTTSSNYSFEVIESLLHTEDKVIEGIYTTEAFTAQSLGNLSVDATVDTDETLEATLTGYNSTEQTGNTSYSLNDGLNEFNPSKFSTNTSTYVVEFNASNGSVVLNDLRITGTTDSASEVAGAAPGGGLFTGNFFSSPVQGIQNAVMAVPNFVSDVLAGLGNFVGGLVA